MRGREEEGLKLIKPPRLTEKVEQKRIELAMRGAQRATGIFEPMDFIRRAVNKHGDKLCVAWSGGKTGE